MLSSHDPRGGVSGGDPIAIGAGRTLLQLVDRDTVRYLAARKGHEWQQKNVAVFAEGPDALYEIRVPGVDLRDPATVERLGAVAQSAGIENRTFAEDDGGARMVIIDPGQGLGDNVLRLADELGIERVTRRRGDAEFPGDPGWSDRRAAAREYERIEHEYETSRGLRRRLAAGTWQGDDPGWWWEEDQVAGTFDPGIGADSRGGHLETPCTSGNPMYLPSAIFGFREDQPRDEQGRWTDAGGGGGKGVASDAVVQRALAHPRFQRWFGRSKVVDGAGRPRVVFHGTEADITTFGTDPGGDRPGYDLDRIGVWFADEPRLSNAVLEHYDGEREGTARVYPAMLRIENPLVVVNREGFESTLLTTASRYTDHSGGSTGQLRDWRDRAKEAAFDQADLLREEVFTPEIAREVKAALVRAGYDGVHIKSDFDLGGAWLAFHPDQVKSPFSRDFNPNNNDILAFDPDQARDEHGRWTTGGGSAPAPAHEGKPVRTLYRGDADLRHADVRPLDPRSKPPFMVFFTSR